MKTLALLLAGALGACGRSEAPPVEPLPTTPVAVGPPGPVAALATEFTGVIASREVLVIAAPFTAQVDRLEVSPGSTFHAGDVLAHFDETAIRSQIEIKKADVRRGHAQSAVAAAEGKAAGVDVKTSTIMNHLDYESSSTVAKNQAIADSKRSGAAEGQAAADGATASLDELQGRLAKATVQAPFDGVVMRVTVKPGESVADGKTILELQDPHALLVRFAVPKAQRDQFVKGQRVAVHVEGIVDPVWATVAIIQEQQGATMPITVVEADLDPAAVTGARIHLASQARVTLGS